jgi:hypothetical protein
VAGQPLSPVRRQFTLESMNEMTPGVNYHTDAEAAQRAGFSEPNVGSAQFLPMLYEMIEDTFGLDPETMRGTFSVRFRRPVLAAVDTVAQGTFETDQGAGVYRLTMSITQGTEDACPGTAEIRIPRT